MFYDLKANNARLLSEFAGLGEAMEAAFEKEKMIESTELRRGKK